MKAPNKWTIAAVLTFGPAMALMDSTIVSVILTQMQETFHTDFATITWIATSYFLAQATVIPIVGYVSDHIGSKQVYLTALTLFTVGSLLCALASTKEALFAFRVLQGIGGGALVPMSLAIVYRIFPLHERAKAAGIITAPIMLARALGPTIGGYLATSFSWNAVFMVNVPLGSVALFFCFLLLPGDKPTRSEQTKGARKQFDVPGLLLAMAGVAVLVFGIAQVGSKGWSDQTVLIPILMGVTALAIFTVVELRSSDPVMDLRLFQNPTFTLSSLLIWVILGGATGGLFLLPLFFEHVQGNTALTAGVFMIGHGVGVAVSMLTAGMLYNRIGPRNLAVLGLLLLVIGTYKLAHIDVNTTGQDLQIWLLLRGLSLGFVYQPAQMLALSRVSNKGMAKATSLVNVTEQVATAAAVAMLTTYLTERTATYGVGQQALAMGMADTFWLVLVLGVACIPLALLLGRKSATRVQQPKKAPENEISVSEVNSEATSIGNVISIANSGGVMGPEILLWHYPKNDDISNGSQLLVEYNHFCVLKLQGSVFKVYEAGQHVVQTLDSLLFGSVQLTFDDELIPWQYEAIYINCATLQLKYETVVTSRELKEVYYCVDYSIRVVNQKGAVQLIQRMLYDSHTLSIQDINRYTGPVIEEALGHTDLRSDRPLSKRNTQSRDRIAPVRLAPLNADWYQRLLMTPLEPAQRSYMAQDYSQLVHQRLHAFLSSYGITLERVQVYALTNPLNATVREAYGF